MRPWHDAWQRALYGPDGFYRTTSPADHFRTGVHAGPGLATALSRLAHACGLRRVLDVGTGRGELLAALADVDPDLALAGVDVGTRPDGLPTRVAWRTAPGGRDLPDLADLARDALVVAHEWLDDVPCPVLEVAEAGVLRVVEVDAAGHERLGAPASHADLAWAARWWPVDGAPTGTRVEVGTPREQAWRGLAALAVGSVLVCVDYAHARGDRPAQGTLTGYRAGRQCPPVPDGAHDVTAHVALDAVAAAVPGTRWSLLTTQRQALRALGVSGALPPHALAVSDPGAYLRGLTAASGAAELLDPAGLGGFGWLVQSLGPPVPEALAGLAQPATGSRS